MRGFQISPAGVDIFVVFDETISENFVATALAQWGSLTPCRLTLEVDALLENHAEGTLVVSQRSHQEVVTDYPAATHTLMVDDEERAFERLTVEVTLRMLEHLAGSLNLLHAAALSDSASGHAMVLVGPSGRGKTTASRFLGKKFNYLSDETAIIQSDFHLRPYPKPLSLITAEHQSKQQIDPASLGIATVAPSDYSFELKHLILLNRQQEATSPRLDRVALADALIEIVEQTSGVRRTERGIEGLIEVVNHCGGALRLTYSEISDTLGLLQDLMGGKVIFPSEEVSLYMEKADDGEEARSQDENTGLLRRYPQSSVFQIDERTLISTKDWLIEVSPFAAEIWFELLTPATAESLKNRLEQQVGPIPDDAFKATLESLRDHEIIL